MPPLLRIMGVRSTADRDHDRRKFPTGFPIRCTHEEKRRIYLSAQEARLSASRFLVEMAMHEDRGAGGRPSPEDVTVLEGLIVHLRRLGSSLNELAGRGQTAKYFDLTP